MNGRRYFIAKDCFAKFLPLDAVTLVDQHVGRPEPGTMISVMSAASRPGQLISIQRVSTVHVQHCFLNAPHRRPGPEIPLLAVNTRLHCQCPNCGPCAHVIKPPRTQRLARPGKNATHMCQFSTYTCCGMRSQEEALCTYKGNRPIALPPFSSSVGAPPPVGNSWIAGSGYLSNLQAQQMKSMPEEYRLGAAPEDSIQTLRRLSKSSSRRSSSRQENAERSNQPNRSRSSSRDQRNSIVTSSGSDSDCNQILGQADILSSPLTGDQVRQNDQCNPIGQITASPKNSLRDYVDNRYFYPSEDLIDSTLEADLEKLSQARYGAHKCNSHRMNPSKNIIKSLKSFISCLTMQSTSSDFQSEVEKFECATDANRHISCDTIPMELHTLDTERSANAEIFDFDDCLVATDTADPRCIRDSIDASKHQASSSSDCGFSSASQNSNAGLSPTKSNKIEQVESQVYMRIASRLIKSLSISDQEVSKLKGFLRNDNKAQDDDAESSDLDQMIADVIRRMLLEEDIETEAKQKTDAQCGADPRQELLIDMAQDSLPRV